MKFAQVGYGSMGQGVNRTNGEGYTYLVEDNVKMGAKLTPVVKHTKSQTMFVTTGVVIDEPKNTFDTVIGKSGVITQDELTRAYTARQLGVYGSRGKGGKFAKEESYHDENGNYVLSNKELEMRAKSVAVYEKEQRDKGKLPEWSEGKATERAMDELGKMQKSQRSKL